MTEPVEDHQPEPGANHHATAPDDAEAPRTGDIVIDAALRDLSAADPADLDAQLHAGDALQRTLQARLADLGS